MLLLFAFKFERMHEPFNLLLLLLCWLLLLLWPLLLLLLGGEPAVVDAADPLVLAF